MVRVDHLIVADTLENLGLARGISLFTADAEEPAQVIAYLKTPRA
jgi:hypothetical protein